jgi:putative hydrolase of the HAD superfamily
MKIENKKAVFFDLDHTLWDFEKNSALVFEVILEKYKIRVDVAEFIKHYSLINANYWKLYRDGHITQQELRYGRLKETFDTVGYETDDELLNILSEEYITRLPQNKHLHEGAIEILEYLKPKYSLHIITNGFHEAQEGKLKHSNIGHYFETVTNSQMAGCKKPHPGIFEYALKLANADKETSVMIGDCIEADVQGALDYGLDAIYFNENRLEVRDGVSQIHHLLDLKKLL